MQYVVLRHGLARSVL